MNIFTLKDLSGFNKATAAAVSQAVLQIIAAFVEFPPELEQAIGVIMTSVLVYVVPNRMPPASAVASPQPASGKPLIAHLPLPSMIAAVALSAVAAGCAAIVSGDTLADRVLGPDCGPESRLLRAEALVRSLGRVYPELGFEAVRGGLTAMAGAVDSGAPIEPSAAAFKDALVATLAPVVLAAGRGDEPFWVSLAHLPPLAAELALIRADVSRFCAAA